MKTRIYAAPAVYYIFSQMKYSTRDLTSITKLLYYSGTSRETSSYCWSPWFIQPNPCVLRDKMWLFKAQSLKILVQNNHEAELGKHWLNADSAIIILNLITSLPFSGGCARIPSQRLGSLAVRMRIKLDTEQR